MLCVMSLMSFSGRWIPSKIEPMIPGPSSTERGFPVRSTGSPTETPAVSELRKTTEGRKDGNERKRETGDTGACRNQEVKSTIYVKYDKK